MSHCEKPACQAHIKYRIKSDEQFRVFKAKRWPKILRAIIKDASKGRCWRMEYLDCEQQLFVESQGFSTHPDYEGGTIITWDKMECPDIEARCFDNLPKT